MKQLYFWLFSQVVDKAKNVTEIPEWFSGSRLNYAENLLRYKDGKTAIIECGESLDRYHQKLIATTTNSWYHNYTV